MTTSVDPTPATDSARRAAVYRLYDSAGALLYIGSAFDPEKRCQAHRRKPWWRQVAQRVDEWHATRVHAYTAEMAAISIERSAYNVMGTEAYREECRRLALVDPVRRARNAAGSAAANGASREIVDAILRGELRGYGRRTGPVPFE